MRRAALLCACVFAAGCGASGLGDDDTAGDAGVCDIGITYTPTDPVTGTPVYVDAVVPVGGSFFTYSWSVTYSGAVPFDYVAADQSRIMFTPLAGDSGPYYVSLSVDGSGCNAFDGVINVRDPAATDTAWRMRFHTPLAPPQEITVNIPSGADYDYGDIPLDVGDTITGTVRDGSGTPVPAYLALTPGGTPDLTIDGFAGTDGTFSIRTTLVHQDLLVVPFRDDLPAMAMTNWSPISGDLTVTTGQVVNGHVYAPGGAGLVGAYVMIEIDGVPSTVVQTTAGGAFTMHVRPGTAGLVEVDVVPPAGSGLPRLDSSPATLDLSQGVSVTYQSSVVLRDVGGAAISQGGSSQPGARVTFTGDVPAAAAVQAGLAVAQANGHFAISAVANGAGALPSTLVPAVATEAVVLPTNGTAGVLAVDLSAGAPAAIDAPAPAFISGRIVDHAGAAVPGADLRAAPIGALAAADLSQVHVVANPDGTFTLPLAGGGHYDLTALDAGGGNALLRTPLDVIATTDLGDFELPDGLELRGHVLAGSQSALNAAVTIYCEGPACTGDERNRPAAECTTGSTGEFHATVVDPGLP